MNGEKPLLKVSRLILVWVMTLTCQYPVEVSYLVEIINMKKSYESSSVPARY